MLQRSVWTLLAIATIAAGARESGAQVYGNAPMPGYPSGAIATPGRNLGGSLASQPGTLFSGNLSALNQSKSATPTKPGTAASPTVGADWLIQRKHGAGAFVGVDDSANFVGAQQTDDTGADAANSAATNLPPVKFNTGVNMLLPARKITDIYYPQVKIAFDYPAPKSPQVSSALVQQLKGTPGLQLTSPIEVSVEDRTATIRGEVASERDRSLVEQIALFEPGISSVRNLLTLKAPATQPQPPSTDSHPAKAQPATD